MEVESRVALINSIDIELDMSNAVWKRLRLTVGHGAKPDPFQTKYKCSFI